MEGLGKELHLKEDLREENVLKEAAGGKLL